MKGNLKKNSKYNSQKLSTFKRHITKTAKKVRKDDIS